MRENRKGAVKDLQINLVFFQFLYALRLVEGSQIVRRLRHLHPGGKCNSYFEEKYEKAIKACQVARDLRGDYWETDANPQRLNV